MVQGFFQIDVIKRKSCPGVAGAYAYGLPYIAKVQRCEQLPIAENSARDVPNNSDCFQAM